MSTQSNAVADAVEIICRTGNRVSPVKNSAYGVFAPEGLQDFYQSKLHSIACRIFSASGVKVKDEVLGEIASGITQGKKFEKTGLDEGAGGLVEEMYNRALGSFRFKSFTGFGQLADPEFGAFFEKACRAIWIVVEGKARDTHQHDSITPNYGSEILGQVVNVFAGRFDICAAYKKLMKSFEDGRIAGISLDQFFEILDRIAGADDTPLTRVWKGMSPDWYTANRDFIAVLRWREDEIGSHEPEEPASFKISNPYPSKPVPAVSFQARIADIRYEDFKQVLDGMRGPDNLLRLVVTSRDMLGNARIKFHSVLDLVEKGTAEIVGFCPAMEKELKHQLRSRANTKVHDMQRAVTQVAAVYSD